MITHLNFFKLNLNQTLHLPHLLELAPPSPSSTLLQNRQQHWWSFHHQMEEPVFCSPCCLLPLVVLLTLVGLVTSTDAGPWIHFQHLQAPHQVSRWQPLQQYFYFHMEPLPRCRKTVGVMWSFFSHGSRTSVVFFFLDI